MQQSTITLEQAMDLADHASPAPASASMALKAMRAEIERLTDVLNGKLAGSCDYVPGELDRSAPARIWLQIDTDGGNSDRGEQWPGAFDVTWHDEPIGGLEIQYVRADLAAPAAEQWREDVATLLDAVDGLHGHGSTDVECRHCEAVNRLSDMLSTAPEVPHG